MSEDLAATDLPDGDLLFPASFAQARLWFLQRLMPQSPAYNIAMARLLRGPLQETALQHAIDMLVERHETLRTHFAVVDDEPMQRVLQNQTIRIATAELPDTDSASLQDLINALARQPFDLGAEPLLRVHLHSQNDTHLLVIVIHHIIADAGSLEILFSELVRLYNAACTGEALELPELPIQYGDFADWQQEQFNSAAQQQQLEFWRQQLRGAPAMLDLPTDRPRPNVQSYAGDTLSRALPAPLLEKLKRIAQQSGATLFVVLLAAYTTLLGRYSGSRDVVVGTPMSGRDREEIAGIIGLLLNTLALRLEFDTAKTFRDMVDTARAVAFAAFANPDVPFEKLVDELQPRRDMSFSPLFQTMLVLQQIDEGGFIPMLDLEADAIPFTTHTAKFDLTLFVTESGTDSSLIFEYNTDLFDASTIERMLEHFLVLLQTVADDPDIAIDAISLLDNAERDRLVRQFNDTTAEFDPAATISSLFRDQVARTPDASALRAAEESLTYRELDRRSDVLATALAAQGAGPGTRTVICCPRDPLLPVAVLACVKAGTCYVPIDPAYPAERIEAMLGDSGPQVVLYHSSIELPEHSSQRIRLDRFDFSGTASPPPGPTPESALYCIYTSGSTGKPKGVQLSHRSLANLLQWQARHARLGQPARTLQFTSFSFDVSFQEVFSTWCNGGELVMLTDAQRQDFVQLAGIISRQGIERLFLPFAALQPLAEIWETAPTELALRDVVVAGEQLKVTAAVRALFRHCKDAALHNQYGPSETHVVTALTLTGDPDGWPALPSIGVPVANTFCYVLDDRLQPLPIGLPGELYLGGAQVALGYLKRPELDKEKFVPNPFIPGDRLYRTGDRARFLVNGEIEFLGRVDEQFKWRGFRIEPGEIETALSADASVEDAVVVIRNDTGDPRLVAYVTPASPAMPDTSQLARALKQKLPDYMQPTLIVVLEQLPLTPSGKVARRALPVPDYSQIQTAPFVAPRNPTEEVLADLYRQVLKAERVSIHDDFFALGGHSLLATQLIARVRQTLDVEASLIDLFSQPTIAAFSERIDELRGIAGPPALRPQPRPANLPLSFAQQRLWFLDQLEPGNPVYNFPIVLRLNGAVDETALRAAVQTLTDRHESLRTCFATANNQPVQIIETNVEVRIDSRDLRAASPAACAALVEELVQAPFDLAIAPLLNVHLLKTGDTAFTLVLVTHHIVSDGWSLGVLLNELGHCYTRLSRGETPQLAPLPIQYPDYALWQRNWFAGAELARQLDYWRKELEGAPPVLDIPTDRPRPTEQSFNGSGRLRQLSPDLHAQLQELARREGCTLYMVLLAGLNVLLGRYAAVDDVVIGSPIAGRRMQETEGLIGFFANTLAIRTQFDGNPVFRQLLARVRANTLAAHNHQDLPFEKLVEELQPERDLSHAPIFQVMFVLQNNPDQPVQFGDLDYSFPEFEMGIAKFDLLFDIAEEHAGLRTGIQFNSDLFDGTSIERMLEHFEALLAAICANPDARLAELSFIGTTERARVITEFNNTATDYGPAVCAHALVEAQAVRTPTVTALSCGEAKLTYEQVNQHANALAAHLRSLGAGRGSIVAIAAKRCIELPIAVLAVLKTGACYTPVDPAYPAERVSNMLEDAAASLVITQTDVELPVMNAQLVHLDQFDFRGSAAAAAGAIPPVMPEQPAYCIYTSGSTGKPKGVQLSHAGLTNLLRWQAQHDRLKKAAKTLQFASLSFDVSFQEIFSTWSNGGELVMIDDELRQDLYALADFIAEQAIARLYLPFAAFQPIARALADSAVRPAIRDVIVAGEQLQITADVRALFAKLEDAALHNQYGPSETHVVTATTLMGDPSPWPALPSIGKPVANTQCYVLDLKQNPLPVGLPGELYLGGRQLALGYLNRPELNRGKFVNNPFELGTRLYRTGDQVRWRDNGEIEFLGRVDEQLKWRGFRVEPGEIETVLCSLDLIANAAVLLREDQPGDKRLVAYVTPAGTNKPAPADIQQQLKALLPEFMQPSLVVVLDELPLTPSGKVARRRLPIPDYGRSDAAPIVEPRNAVETILVELWQNVLNVPAISVHDDFFSLGGHSLLATQLVARIRDELGVALPLKYIFRYPSPASLGETIVALKATSLANETDADDQDYEEISI